LTLAYSQTNPALADVKIGRHEYAFLSSDKIFLHGFTMRYYGLGEVSAQVLRVKGSMSVY
jgi:hypothetical protein